MVLLPDLLLPLLILAGVIEEVVMFDRHMIAV
jgi:hypothetical protein